MSEVRTLTEKDVQLLKETRYQGFPDKEMELFRRTCNRVQLDPFAGQIMLDRRWIGGSEADGGHNVFAPYTQIDGFRVIAERTEDYAGQVGPHWYDADPNNERGYQSEEDRWFDVWPFYMGPRDERRHPYAARVAILRKGFDEPLVSIVRWDAYAQYAGRGAERRLNRVWVQRGDFQLAKCAEALGLRRACPNLLSGLYTEEEIEAIKASEEAEAAGEEEDLSVFDRKITTEESEAARDEWLQKVADADVESLPDMREAFSEAFSDDLLPLHQAEVLGAITKRLNPPEESGEAQS